MHIATSTVFRSNGASMKREGKKSDLLNDALCADDAAETQTDNEDTSAADSPAPGACMALC
jgi:hypothetical protein